MSRLFLYDLQYASKILIIAKKLRTRFHKWKNLPNIRGTFGAFYKSEK